MKFPLLLAQKLSSAAQILSKYYAKNSSPQTCTNAHLMPHPIHERHMGE